MERVQIFAGGLLIGLSLGLLIGGVGIFMWIAA